MNDLRVMAGKYKGTALKVPNSARPVTTRVKAVVFDTLMQYIEGAMILDLFAGSGNMGIEALSRGADYAVFVDHNEESIECIKQNLKKIRAENDSNSYQMDYKIYLKRTSDQFDLIFIDPPFDFIENLHLRYLTGALKKDGIVILKTEASSRIKLPPDLMINYEKIVGENKLFFITHKI